MLTSSPPLSAADVIIKGLKKSRNELAKLARSLPNEDAYATAYCVLIDGVNAIGDLITTIKPSLKEAKEYRKQNPTQFPNRAKKWCAINDSRRKQSPSPEGTDSPNEETP